MSLIELLALAVALAMDAFAVSVTTGIRMRCNPAAMFRMAFMFGLFQFIMPVAGWLLGFSVRSYIETYDHWVAFGLLFIIGGRMLLGALRGEEPDRSADPTRGLTLLALAVATSLDALAVGISIALLKVDIWFAATVIGVVCFAISGTGVAIGGLLKIRSGRVGELANAAGGLVLLGIGVKILYEHGVFA